MTVPTPVLAALSVLASLSLATPVRAPAPRTPPPRDPVASLAEPALSPDASEVAFVSGGDIWTASAKGGEARLLVSHSATESRPLYSPDGRSLAFTSTRTGNGDVYVLTFATGELRRLTFDDGFDQLDGWSRDGRWLYFSSTSRDIAGMNDIFRVSVDGGTPMAVSADRYANEYWAAPSPDGKTLALTARGITSSQWWRKGHSHLDESELWLMRESAAGAPSYERVGADTGAKEMWPMWTADGRALYYVSDRGGAQNVWTRPLGGAAARQVTSFKDGRVLWPSISNDGRAIVFERDFRIWRLDVSAGEAREIPLTLRGAPAGPAVDHVVLNSDLQELALSPDAKKVAFIVRGELFAALAKEGGDAQRITTTTANETGVEWSPDSRRLVYVSDRDGPQHLYLYDFATRVESRLTSDAKSDVSPRFSPDGAMIAFERDGRELRVVDVAPKADRLLATGYLERAPFVTTRAFAWSPDSKWIAYSSISGKQFSNAYVVPASGGASRPVSFLANVFGGSVSWSPDGTYLLFGTRQRTEEGQIARVDLVPRTPKFREDQFRDLFRDESPRPTNPPPPARPDTRDPRTDTRPTTPARDSLLAAGPKPDSGVRRAPKAVTIAFDDIRKRLSLLPIGIDVGSQTISPDGKWALLVASAAGQQNLYVYPLDELARDQPVARQLTSTAGAKRGVQWSADSKEVYYLDAGRINVLPLDTRQARTVAVSAEMDVDFAREKMEVFAQAWSYLRDNFFDANFNGVSWDAVRDDYAPRIAGARTPDEMRRVLSLMVGELNASHSGIGAPAGTSQPSTGRLGLRFDRAEYERAGKLRVTDVIPLSPAALTGNIKAGDYLIAVDGTRIDARTNLDQLLDRKIGRRVALTVASAASGVPPREVAVRPTNAATEKGLLYREWVDEKRAYVAKVSNGRLGYAHMIDMGAGALAQLYVDLDAENHARDGVVIDVRNNNGGFVNAYALDVLARRPYLTMTQRGLPSAPARTVLGQRALEAPTVLVTNQHSLSDAEDFTEGYRTLKLGKVVGEPTAGWIIYTSGATLVDGSTVRIPFTKITASDGTPMEMHPRPVDVLVERPIGESYTGRDSQLDAAVRELLKDLGTQGTKVRPLP